MPEPEQENFDPTLTIPHVSNRILNAHLVYFTELAGADFVREVVLEAGLPLDYLRDTERWVSLEFADRFTKILARRLYGIEGVPPWDHAFWQHCRAIGWITFRRDVIGPIYHVLRALGSPGFFYRQLPTLIPRGNRATMAELVSHGRNFCVVRVRATEPALADSLPACWSRFGLLEGAPLVWGLPKAEVEHPVCMHDPDNPGEYCEYRVIFRERGLEHWLPPVLLISAASGVGALAAQALALDPQSAPGWLLGALVGLSLEGWRRNLNTARARREDVERLNDLLGEADLHYRELWDERQALRRTLLINRKIAGYLAIDLVDRIVRNPEIENTLGGVRTEAAVLFADIVGFTPRCERRSPEDIVAELNLYFGEIDQVISRHGGIIDKRLGDGVMVVFTAPADTPLQADLHRRAILCGLEMLRILPECNRKLEARGAPPLQIRIGLAAGELVLGNMGSEAKLEYTVIGDVVNLAARLEGQALPGHLLMPRTMLEAVGDPVSVTGERIIKVKGKEAPVEVVELSPATQIDRAGALGALPAAE